jgi:hypothetical protein
MKVPSSKVKNKCQVCKKKKATITYAQSFLDYTHGFAERLCKDCYRNKLQRTINSCKERLKELDKTKDETQKKKTKKTS